MLSVPALSATSIGEETPYTIGNGRMRKFVLVLSTVLGLCCSLAVSGLATGTEYNQSVSAGIPALSYWYGTMELTSGEYVHLNLQVTGSASFFFVDSAGFSKLQSTQSFSYFALLSVQHSNKIDNTAQVPYAGTWYIVVENLDGLNSLSLTGHITASSSLSAAQTGLPDAFYLAVILASVIVIVFAIGYIVVSRRSGHELSSNAVKPMHERSQDRMRFCSYCGNPVAPGMMYCPHCGREF